MSLRAFLALYDLTGSTSWLNAAVQAAYYYSTWVYAWNVPIPTNDPSVTYPPGRLDTGEGVIATSGSGSDPYAATDAFNFYRLYLLTGDTQFLKEAKLFLYNTKQALNWDPMHPIPGWGPLGIIPEALTLVAPRGHGVGYYLPWETANYMESMIDLRDVFGSFDIDQIQQQPFAQRQSENIAYGRTRGYALPRMVLSASSEYSKVDLEWTAWTNAVSYTVERSTSSGGAYATIANVTGTSFIDTNVVNGTTYYYIVSAVTKLGKTVTSSSVSVIPRNPLSALY